MSKRKRRPRQLPRELPQFLDAPHWDLVRLHRLLSDLRGASVLVVGDVGVDRYTVGSVDRISPEAPVPVVQVTQETLKLGLAANVADNIRALQGTALLVGVIGKDRGAEDLRELLKAQQISASYLVADAARRTVLKERVVSDRQQLVRIDYETLEPLSLATQRRLTQKAREGLRGAEVVIIEDYAKGLLSGEICSELVSRARARGLTVVVDPNAKTPARSYRGVDGLTPNTKEAEALSGITIRDLESLERAGRAILKSTGARWLVITRGKDGMALFERARSQVRVIPTTAREVYDVSGAGDTVIAVIAMALSRGASLEEACILGNVAAGVEVGKRGTATVTVDEVRDALDSAVARG